MGALPTRKISKRRAGFRKQNQKITKLPQLMICPHCRNPKQTHHVCLTCGMYKGRQVIEPRQRANAPS
jgi:large subunit ribosomal protein L32